MSGNADTIKDFLVSLGFDIDQAGANKFEAVLKGVTANVLKVGAVVEGAALSIVGFTTQIANGLDKIYWASQRTGASVQGIKALAMPHRKLAPALSRPCPPSKGWLASCVAIRGRKGS